MPQGHYEGDRYIAGYYEPAEIEVETIAAATNGEDGSLRFQDYIDIIAEVDRDTKLHTAKIRREQHIWKEFTEE